MSRSASSPSHCSTYKEKDNVWVSEIGYQPTHWPRAYRMLLGREKLLETEQPTLLETVNYRYHAIITNREEGSTERVPEHLLRATAENFIRETKYGLALDRFPCGEFHANWAYLTIVMLVYNLVSWIKRLALPGLHKKSS